MHLVCSTDSRYVMPTGVMIKSVCINNAEREIVFHIIIDESVNNKQKEQLKQCVCNKGLHKVLFHLVSSHDLSDLPGLDKKVKDYITVAAYYRLLIPKIIDKNITRALYLDGDIICNGNLNELWNTNIEGKAIAVVKDMSEACQEYDRLAYPKQLGYFNSGVLLLNLDYWRKHFVMQRCFDFIQKNPEQIKFHDQDVLNIVLCKEKLNLPLKFNVQNGFLYENDKLMFDKSQCEKELKEARNHPIIIHYTASRKPWFKDCKHPYRDMWFYYLKQTPWKGYRPLWRRGIRGFIGYILRTSHILPPSSYEPFLRLTVESDS